MKEYKYFIDSNIFLRTLLKDVESNFDDCLAFLKAVKKGEIRAFSSNLVLAEINWTLTRFYKFSKAKTISALNSIISLKKLKFIDDYEPPLAMKIYQLHKIKFIDAVLASNPTIFKRQIIIISYDRDFDKLKVLRQEPKQVLKRLS